MKTTRLLMNRYGAVILVLIACIAQGCVCSNRPPSINLREKNDHEGAASLVRELKSLYPRIITKRLEQIPDFTDAHAIRAVVCSVPDSKRIAISYRSKKRLWEDRQCMPNTRFTSFMKQEPNLYWCLVYLSIYRRITVWYKETDYGFHIFLFDTSSYGIRYEARMALPPGIKELPIEHLPDHLEKATIMKEPLHDKEPASSQKDPQSSHLPEKDPFALEE